MSIDVLHLIKKQQNFSGDELKLIYYLKELSLIETKQLLSKVSDLMDKQSMFILDEKKVGDKEKILVAPFSGLTVAELRKRLHPNFASSPLKLFSQGDLPVRTKKLALEFPPIIGNVFLTITTPKMSWVLSGDQSHYFSIKESNSAFADLSKNAMYSLNIAEYIYQGFVHILPQGLDHILFVLALFLLATKTSTLLWQVSAFTLAHTITLALGIFGIITLPSNIVEPLIALSIAYVAIENIYQQKMTKSRLPVIFAFGLLHGLGFASVLLEVGIPESEYISSLLSFNLGVELGQITVIALALLVTHWISKKAGYRTYFVIPASAIISAIALYWFFERVA
jgi:hydrogenase/urease accessory protein HupE